MEHVARDGLWKTSMIRIHAIFVLIKESMGSIQKEWVEIHIKTFGYLWVLTLGHHLLHWHMSSLPIRSCLGLLIFEGNIFLHNKIHWRGCVHLISACFGAQETLPQCSGACISTLLFTFPYTSLTRSDLAVDYRYNKWIWHYSRRLSQLTHETALRLDFVHRNLHRINHTIVR